jgi:hypothetical protein
MKMYDHAFGQALGRRYDIQEVIGEYVKTPLK